MAGNLYTTFTYIALCFVCFGFYSFDQLKNMLYPLLDLLSYIRLPFIERIENLLFGFFMFTTLVTVVMYIWSAQEALRRIVPKANTKVLAFVIIAAAFAVAWLPDTLEEVGMWLQYLGYTETGVAFGLPLLLLVILLFNKGVRQ
ncbi:GerAB/ArcD/ProY family transporter [Paenibacillus alkaliterrae]|uniref:GerAB/ArcD/ProY family transporter n=1 Tax=Paenibacillus alkaliterrae TaxID=320909 RepID=UPI001F251462|nr:GerAB/ArcD/ProY family transporter [Paenibacillus alkaliterrae]MCF2940343.1 GerAB/ArcD/ProY family transporter [Paenibacillus alkaliterrae]